MNANHYEEIYKTARKFNSFRDKRAQFKVQDDFDGWRTLFCLEDIDAVRGYKYHIDGRAAENGGRFRKIRVLDRSGKVVNV